jgi:hypothetical protein
LAAVFTAASLEEKVDSAVAAALALDCVVCSAVIGAFLRATSVVTMFVRRQVDGGRLGRQRGTPNVALCYGGGGRTLRWSGV